MAMLYSFAKILIKTGLRFFFRHIFVTGLEHIPAKGPAIIIANHHSSLMDAALLGILLRRKAWFFARGDVFINKAVHQLLGWFHMMPVYSYGSRDTLHANDTGFLQGKRILAGGGILVFFPESSSHTEHRLLPFRKGVFRLAFDTLAEPGFTGDIPVVPVGISYDHPRHGRTNVQLHAGRPLMLAEYNDLYRHNSAAALLRISKDAYQAIHDLTLHIPDEGRLQAAEHYLTLCRNNHPVTTTAWKIISTSQLKREKNICAAINTMWPADFTEQAGVSANYFSLLRGAGLEDKTICAGISLPSWKQVLLWAGFPVYILGMALNALPVWAARQLANKKVYREDFYSWIFVICYSVMYFLWMALLFFITAGLMGWWGAAALLVLMAVTGVFAYRYKDWQAAAAQYKKWALLDGSLRQQLTAGRKSCLNSMQAFYPPMKKV